MSDPAGDRPSDGLESAEPPSPPVPVAVLDLGATSIRLVVAEVLANREIRVVEEATRGVLIGKDTFTSGRIGAATLDATLNAVEGFRKIMEQYEVRLYRAVATSAVREASNRESFLDRIRQRTGIEVQMIDGPEENRLTYLGVQADLGSHEALSSGETLLVEIGGGSADISFLRRGEPLRSGTYALGSIRMGQRLATWHGSPEGRIEVLRRNIHNIVNDIHREMPLERAQHFVALGGDARFAASRLEARDVAGAKARSVGREAFLAFCREIAGRSFDSLVDRYNLQLADAETLVPALLAYEELLSVTPAEELIIPESTMRDGLLLDIVHGEEGQDGDQFRRQVLAGAAALGERYGYDPAHARAVARMATSLFDDLKDEHGLKFHSRLLLEVAALLHDIGIFVGIRGHHKHSHYILSVSEIFGLSRDDMSVVANVARYHRRAMPQKSHVPYMLLDREQRVEVVKLAAILRLANALDADHLQKIRNARLRRDEDPWVLEVEGTSDVTIEKMAAMARSDLFTEAFGRKIVFRETEVTI